MRLPLGLLVLVALALPGQAGTPAHPEVWDTPDDSFGAPDITALWYEVNATSISVHVAVTVPRDNGTLCAEEACGGITPLVRVALRVLAPNGTAAPTLPDYGFLRLEYRWGPEGGAGTAWHVNATGVPQWVGTVPVQVASTSVSFAVHRTHPLVAIPLLPEPGAYRLNASHATSLVERCHPATAASPAGCTSIARPAGDAVWDRAPDTGFGNEYVFPAPLPTMTETRTATQSVTSTVTATATRTTEAITILTETATPFPSSLSRHGLPGPGILVLVALVGMALAGRRRLA